MGKRILLINLDALGNVLRTTSILSAVKAKYKGSFLVWLTEKNALPLLENNPLIDRAYPYSFENVTPLLCEKFDLLMNADKSRKAASLASLIKADEKFGFGLTPTGVICPLNREAGELYDLGLNDEDKFKKNKKTEQELLAGALSLEYKRDEYALNLTAEEKAFVREYRKTLGLKNGEMLLGFNTGCSNLYPYKKLSAKKQAELLDSLLSLLDNVRIALLGGREDTENNEALARRFKNRIISTPTDMGLRKGILFIDSCDLVISGDTLALHIAIALKKPVVVWFTESCENEIDLYERGLKVVPDLNCRPCWKRICSNLPKCNEVVDTAAICDSVKTLIKRKEAAVIK